MHSYNVNIFLSILYNLKTIIRLFIKKIKICFYLINNNSYSIDMRGHTQVIIFVILFLESRHA